MLALAEAAERIVKALKPAYALAGDGDLSVGTNLGRAIVALGEYAVRGKVPRQEVEALIAQLAPLRACAEVVGSLDPAEPETPLEFLVAGARARAALDAGEVMTSLQLALLAGLDRDHVNGMALREQIPSAYRSAETKHRPWRFRNTKALRAWVAGYIEAAA